MRAITLGDLHSIVPATHSSKLEALVDPLNAAMSEFEINTYERVCAFLAQCAEESDGFNTFTEYASGRAYEGRLDLGNTEPGDGVKYKGEGLIETTGKTNAFRVADHFGIDHADIVDWMKTPEGACRSAGLFWKDHGLNELADAGDFIRITKRINGGLNGEAVREQFWARIKKALAA